MKIILARFIFPILAFIQCVGIPCVHADGPYIAPKHIGIAYLVPVAKIQGDQLFVGDQGFRALELRGKKRIPIDHVILRHHVRLSEGVFLQNNDVNTTSHFPIKCIKKIRQVFIGFSDVSDCEPLSVQIIRFKSAHERSLAEVLFRSDKRFVLVAQGPRNLYQILAPKDLIIFDSIRKGYTSFQKYLDYMSRADERINHDYDGLLAQFNKVRDVATRSLGMDPRAKESGARDLKGLIPWISPAGDPKVEVLDGR